MTPADFAHWRASLGLTYDGAAEALGRGVRQLKEYEHGTAPIPRVVALACTAVFHRLEPYKAPE